MSSPDFPRSSADSAGRPATPRAWPEAARRQVRWTCVAVALALLIPHIVSLLPVRRTQPPGLPAVTSGDEPHYLVILSSLLRDGDLDVADDYASVHRGGDEAGRLFRGAALDHHTTWFAGETRVRWPAVFEVDSRAWRRDSAGHPVPTLRPDASPEQVPTQEHSSHWPGLPFLLVPFTFPLRDSRLVEPAALLCAWAASVGAMAAFVSLARVSGASPRGTAVATILTFLGTPLWHYGRTLFTEAFAAAFAIAAYLAFLGHRRHFFAGLLCGVAVMLKPTNVVFAVPIGVTLLLRRDVAGLVRFSIGPAASAAVSLWLDQRMFGGPLRSPQDFAPGSVLEGAVGLLVSPDHGLLAFAPVVVCAVAGWFSLARRRSDALLLLAPAAGTFLISACFVAWGGGYCFGPRYLVPVLPFLTIGLAHRASLDGGSPWRRADLVLLGAVSVAINALGAIIYSRFWSSHPLAGLLG